MQSLVITDGRTQYPVCVISYLLMIITIHLTQVIFFFDILNFVILFK